MQSIEVARDDVQFIEDRRDSGVVLVGEDTEKLWHLSRGQQSCAYVWVSFLHWKIMLGARLDSNFKIDPLYLVQSFFRTHLNIQTFFYVKKYLLLNIFSLLPFFSSKFPNTKIIILVFNNGQESEETNRSRARTRGASGRSRGIGTCSEERVFVKIFAS